MCRPRTLMASTGFIGSLAVCLSLATCAAGVELATDAEQSHRAIRSSSDAATQLLAERWYALVRLQEWTDATGRFKTRAKYVAHDPDLAWVKLRVVKGVGKDRVVKDIQVPVEKLNSLCKSRVRQIAALTEKVAAAVAAEQAAEADDEEPGATDAPGEFTAPAGGREIAAEGARREFPPRGRDPRNPRAGPDEREMRERPQPIRGRPGGPPVAARSRRPPLPAMLPPLPSGVGFTRNAATRAAPDRTATPGDRNATARETNDGASADPPPGRDSQR